MSDDHAKLLKGLEYALERRFTCVRGLPMAFSQTGEEYFQFAHDGMCPPEREGLFVENRFTCFSAEQAAISLGMHIAEYCVGKRGLLFWRVSPEVEQAANGGWVAYARLLVSDRPMIWPTMAEYELIAGTTSPAILRETVSIAPGTYEKIPN